MTGYSSNAIVCATEIKNSTFLQNASMFVDQHHFPGSFNLIKVSLHDVRMTNPLLIAQGTQGKMILEINNIHYLCFIPRIDSFQVSSLAKLSISSSLESQSHFEFVAISVIDTDVHLSGSLSFKRSSLILEGTSHLVLQEPLSAMFVDKFSEFCLSVATILLVSYLSPEAIICPIQFNTPHIYTADNITDIDIHLTFINTSATAYDYAVHTATIDYCQLYGNISATPREIYNATFMMQMIVIYSVTYQHHQTV